MTWDRWLLLAMRRNGYADHLIDPNFSPNTPQVEWREIDPGAHRRTQSGPHPRYSQHGTLTAEQSMTGMDAQLGSSNDRFSGPDHPDFARLSERPHLAAAREEARAAGLTSWDIFQGNVRIERHDPGVRDSLVAHLDVTPKQAKAIANETGDPIRPAAVE
jgi:hypothetical protein